MSYLNFFGRLFALSAVMFFFQPATAHEGATGVVKERMEAMEQMSGAMREISAMMRGRVAYDAEKVSALALQISGHAGSHLLMLFPEATDDEVSRARAAIWSEWSDFEALALELDVLAKGLAKAAGNTETSETSATAGNAGMLGSEGSVVEALAKEPASVVFRRMSRNCAGCHSQFREKEVRKP